MDGLTKSLVKNAISNLSSFVYNLLYFSCRSQWDNDWAVLRNLVLSMPSDERAKYADECAFLEAVSLDKLPSIMFPYPVVRDDAGIVSVGVEKGLPYAQHNTNGKLFFPKGRCARKIYSGLVGKEGLLGSGCLAKSPHCYQDASFKIESGEILLDVGCAEAIFALDNIERVSKAYLFESASEWRRPLQLTFAPYANKVVIVNKLVADKTTKKSTRLIDAVNGDVSCDAHFFVKMDIEGWERTVIEGNVDFFKSAKVKLSCCVYHRQDDAMVIEKMLHDMGYKTRFSEGWMLTPMNGIHYPYFRHGVIYAQNY